MLSLDQCRQILGAAATRMNDAQIDQLRSELYMLAGIAIGAFKESRKPLEGQQRDETGK